MDDGGWHSPAANRRSTAAIHMTEHGLVRNIYIPPPNGNGRKHLDESTRQAVAHLTAWVDELERRIHEIDLLSEMDDQLHRCCTPDNVYLVTATFLKRLFIRESGALYLFDTETNLVKWVTIWGNPLPVDWTAIQDKCWALRPYSSDVAADIGCSALCYAISDPRPTNYLCVPIVVRDQNRGLLQIWRDNEQPACPETDPSGYLTESQQRLAMAVVELIALALENVKSATHTRRA